MKLAICNETFDGWPLEKAFACARDCGYTGIEIARPLTIAANAKDISPAQRRKVRRQAEAAGLEVVGLHWLLARTEGLHLTSPDVEVRRRTTAYVEELARVCRDFGGSILVFGSPRQRNLLPGVTHDDAMQYAADVLGAAMPVCEEQRVTIALEPLSPAETDFLLTAEQAIELANLVDSPNCRLQLDCKAMASEAKPTAQIVRESKDYLVHFHANDPNGLGPGMEALDFEPIFGALDEIAYQGWVSVEVFDNATGPEKIARDSMAFMQAVLGRMDR